MLVENFFFRNFIFFFISVISDLPIRYNFDNLVSNLTVTFLTCLLYPILFDHLIALLSHDTVINKYVQHRFAQYDVSDMQDRELWIKIRTNFEHFTDQHWRQIDENVWTKMLRFCYTHGFWIDWDMAIPTTMTKAVQDDYYYVWIRNQLETIQQNYNIISKFMIRRINDLGKFSIDQPQT